MTHTVERTRVLPGWRVVLPDPARRAAAEADEPRALVRGDGMIGLLNPAFLEQLGFDPEDDLRGLHFAAFWSHELRADVSRALRDAGGGAERELALDLAYVTGTARQCRIVLRPLGTGLVEARLSVT
ncbi:PAS domain-containing protein [Jannaschia sp. W003]|uniref:PAS domain-containing protein n=1 Tax=Jannaschia sp. W003 TaxID=2867012 RepID=UPI0021A62956|nr:PAS domain-containing protein [Jannaschia sp. W003]UWQ21331.1 PAS domain-containing protein [Jannaschia sp. W003]